jgi:hypothetical protein
MQWPFGDWGAEVVMAGHDHTYERLDVNGMPYFVNGLGGRSIYPFSNVGNLPPGVTSMVRYNSDYGAMLVTATETGMTSQFFNANGVLVDEHTIAKDCGIVPPPPGSHKMYLPGILAADKTPVSTSAAALPSLSSNQFAAGLFERATSFWRPWLRSSIGGILE